MEMYRKIVWKTAEKIQILKRNENLKSKVSF